MPDPDHPNPLSTPTAPAFVRGADHRNLSVPFADSPAAPALSGVQRAVLLASAMLAACAVIAWNALSSHAITPPVSNGGLDPAVIARNGLDASALHWVSIRFDGERFRVDFAPILADAAALEAVRYGVDQAEPDHVLALPANRHLWPVPLDRIGDHVVELPATSRVLSVTVTYTNGESSPVLLYPLNKSRS